MKKFTVASLCLVAALGVSGCAQNPYGNAYDVGEARTVQNVLTGTITKLDAVTMSGGGESTIGTIAGGAVGAILGSKIGGGSGSDIAAIGGGLAGAALGNKAGDAISQRNGVNIVIKLDSGRTIAVVQEVDPNMIFRVGQRVDIYQQGSTTRVVPAN
ncbi:MULTISPECIES: outer membrane lipoprotein [Photobacterium]|uniref:Rickettsia 17 kDa surface antigen family protein n=3 Tax=Photobacterium leiognathi TaxID=553611 RepID=V5F8D5_PHOLE|nr:MULTISPECIES: glycine zipper 2TM domain-containing protein [Photobacterium]MBP2701444.1 glycine zipper 2TM domain-containing protein [Vibrio parahaemolyticus]KJF86647.1 membrane protein [Photobacterium leiognathi]KJF96786.1 membrane protein [Photobacterium leiognathi]KPA53395.1 membrane protein [Photobacterium leiognathi subsp. mandapamensis]MCG3884919.1 glycine zipper 2TM domain-containing protein [Photobacterium leiognathi]